MKGADLISKSTDFYDRFEKYLISIGLDYLGGPESGPAGAQKAIRVITADPKIYFAFYDRAGDSITDEHEMPPDVIARGYRYAYPVECRSEELFCNIVRAAPSDLDFLVIDTDEVIFSPTEVSPDTVLL
jgi:hypothetical protein